MTEVALKRKLESLSTDELGRLSKANPASFRSRLILKVLADRSKKLRESTYSKVDRLSEAITIYVESFDDVNEVSDSLPTTPTQISSSHSDTFPNAFKKDTQVPQSDSDNEQIIDEQQPAWNESPIDSITFSGINTLPPNHVKSDHWKIHDIKFSSAKSKENLKSLN